MQSIAKFQGQGRAIFMS